MGLFKNWLEPTVLEFNTATTRSPLGTELRDFPADQNLHPVSMRKVGRIEPNYICDNCRNEWYYPKYLGGAGFCPRCGYKARSQNG